MNQIFIKYKKSYLRKIIYYLIIKMGLTDIKVLNTTAVIRHLNADLAVTTTAGAEAVANTCGTYALINDIISNLSSIKASIKTEEKKIATAINLEMINATSTAGNAQVFDATTGNGLTVATLTTGTTTGFSASGATIRGQESVIAANHVAVLNTSSADYTDSALTSVLADVWKIVAKLKAGQLAAGTTVDTAATTSLQAT